MPRVCKGNVCKNESDEESESRSFHDDDIEELSKSEKEEPSDFSDEASEHSEEMDEQEEWYENFHSVLENELKHVFGKTHPDDVTEIADILVKWLQKNPQP